MQRKENVTNRIGFPRRLERVRSKAQRQALALGGRWGSFLIRKKKDKMDADVSN